MLAHRLVNFLLVINLICYRRLALGENLNGWDFMEFIEEQHTSYWLDYPRPELRVELKRAVIDGNVDLLKEMLSEETLEANDENVDEICSTARLALIEGHLETAILFIQHAFDNDELVTKKLPKDASPHLRVILYDYNYIREIHEILAPQKPDRIYYADSKGETAIHTAAKKGAWLIVDVLLKIFMDGPNPYQNIVDNDGLSIFHILSAGTNADFVEQFLENAPHDFDIGAAVSTKSNFRPGYTAAHFAFEHCKFASINVLNSRGVDLSIKDANGKTPGEIMCIAFKVNVEAVQPSVFRSDEINSSVRLFNIRDEL